MSTLMLLKDSNEVFSATKMAPKLEDKVLDDESDQISPVTNQNNAQQYVMMGTH